MEHSFTTRRRSRIGERTMRHAGYGLSLISRKFIETVFGDAKTVKGPGHIMGTACGHTPKSGHIGGFRATLTSISCTARTTGALANRTIIQP